MLKKKTIFIKTSIITTFIVLLSTNAKSQVREVIEALKPQKTFAGTPILAKKSQALQVGVGIPNNVANLLEVGGLASLFSSTTSNKIGPIFISYEYLIKENIGLGATLSYAQAKKNYELPISSTRYSAELSGISFLLSSTYHFYITDKLDPYVKASIGVTLWKGSYTDEAGNEAGKVNLPTPVGYSGLIGLRYFVSPKIAPFGELSYSNLRFTANIGMAIKIK